MMPKLFVQFEAESLTFQNYPYRLGALAQQERLDSQAVAAYRLLSTPPALILHSGEILFISAGQRDELNNWAERHQLPEVKVWDSWSWICEPYLDTEFTPQNEALSMQRLNELGFSQDEVQDIRKQIEPLMLAYNSVVWEWGDLGHFDLLNAWKKLGFSLLGLKGPFGPVLNAEIYRWTMKIANRGWFPFDSGSSLK